MKPDFREPYEIDEVIRRIDLPDHARDIPELFLIVGPARSGTTALFLALASNPALDRCYYQPIRSIIRFGFPLLAVNSMDTSILIKETFWAAYSPAVPFDPLRILRRAGYPIRKIRPIFIFRNPVAAYVSWLQHENIPPDVFSEQYLDCLQCWRSCSKEYGIAPITLIYEDLHRSEAQLIATVRSMLGLDDSVGTSFDARAIERKVIWGQGSEPSYFEKLIRPTLTRGRIAFVAARDLPHATEQVIHDACFPAYMEARRSSISCQ